MTIRMYRVEKSHITCVAKSIVKNSWAWEARKRRQDDVGGLPDSTMYRLIVLVLWSTPSLIFISSAIRSSPHSGWSVEMRLMKAMCWRGILGRPGEPPERRLQYRR